MVWVLQALSLGVCTGMQSCLEIPIHRGMHLDAPLVYRKSTIRNRYKSTAETESAVKAGPGKTPRGMRAKTERRGKTPAADQWTRGKSDEEGRPGPSRKSNERSEPARWSDRKRDPADR